MWNTIERSYETILVHQTAPVWIVHYEAIEGSRDFRHEFWQPYRAIEKLKRGRQIWAHDNKRIGDEAEFRSLEAAMAAAEAWIASNMKAAA